MYAREEIILTSVQWFDRGQASQRTTTGIYDKLSDHGHNPLPKPYQNSGVFAITLVVDRPTQVELLNLFAFWISLST